MHKGLALFSKAAAGSASKGKAAVKILNKNTLSQNVLRAQYAVRGEVVIRANRYLSQMEEAKKQGKPSGLPFDDIVFCNIGNPQSLGQKPISFFRHVLALVTSPDLLTKDGIERFFPADAIARAREILATIPGGSGAYSHSKGLESVRRNVAKFIERRDGFTADPEHIFLTDGASPGIQMVMRCLLRHQYDGVMIPIPQYPLYSATVALLGGSQVGYFLDESRGWGMDIAELERSLAESRERGVHARGLVIINPGNPTGQCLDAENMRDIVRFCKRERLVLLADEVYQENSYRADRPFTSFKKVVASMGEEAADVELVSFHSVSKGFLGECGRRGGYMEMHNIDAAVVEEIYKLASINLCPNVDGQIMVDLMVNPPKAGELSHTNYAAERDTILSSLKRRAQMLYEALNKLEGVSCNLPEGAMYAFPRVRLPEKAVAAARAAGMEPDMMYVLAMLEEAGIVCVPGSGFGQEPGTYHFRTTFLPPEDKMQAVVERLAKFHNAFLAKYK